MHNLISQQPLIHTNIHPTWNDFLSRSDVKQELDNIDAELSKTLFYPAQENVLRFMSRDPRSIKVIILGMDPYPSDYEKDGIIYPVATGRSFEVGNLDSWTQKFKQSSLQNILKTIYLNETGELKSLEEIREEIQTGTFKIAEPQEWFNNLESQGVLFLNATLTVAPREPGSHTHIWNHFMDIAISELAKKPKMWLIWGNNARERVTGFVKDTDMITCVHPRLAAFVKQNCFSKISGINWLGTTT